MRINNILVHNLISSKKILGLELPLHGEKQTGGNGCSGEGSTRGPHPGPPYSGRQAPRNAGRLEKDEAWLETPSVCQLNCGGLKETSGL